MGLRKFGRYKLILKSIFQQCWGSSKSGVALRISGVAPKVGEKGVVLKVGERALLHFIPLHAPANVACTRTLTAFNWQKKVMAMLTD